MDWLNKLMMNTSNKKTIFIIGFSVILVVGVLLLIMMSQGGRKKSGLNHVYYRQKWQYIESLQKQGGAGWQVAIMEADKLLDQALKSLGYKGETMGERMKDAKNTFRSNEAVWQAHKVRNRLAHEDTAKLNAIVVSKVLRQFKAALKDVGAL